MKKLLWLFYLFVFSLSQKGDVLYSQNYLANVEFYNYENGLAGRFANCTFKDSRGIVWIGTQFGMNRFDGRDFLTFDEASGLPFNQVMAIFEDSEGWLWLYRTCEGKRSCSKNLAFFHSITHEVLTYEEWFGDNFKLKPEEVLSMISDEEGGLYFTGNKTVFHWEKGKITQTIDLSSWEVTPTLLTLLEKDILIAKLYLTHENGAAKVAYRTFDMNGNILNSKLPPELDAYEGEVSINYLGEDFEGKRIVETDWYKLPDQPNLLLQSDGSLKLDTTNWGTFIKSKNYAYNPYHPQIWQAKEDGTSIYEHTKGEVYNFGDHFPYLSKELSNREIRFDENDVTWLAGRHGVFRIQLKQNPFQRILYNSIAELESSVKHIGMGVVPFENDRLLLFTQSPSFFEMIDGLLVLNEAFSKGIGQNTFTITKGHSNKWWTVNTRQVFNLEQNAEGYRVKSFTSFKRKKYSDVFCLYYQDSRLWFGTNKGLHYFDHQDELIHEFDQFNGFDAIKDIIISQIYKEREDRIWLCTSNGLYLFSPEEGIKRRYWEGGAGSSKIPGTFFYQILPSKQGGWWLAAREGLVYWNPDKTQTKYFTTEQGLPSNEVLAIHEDDYGFIWLATNSGLVQLEIETSNLKTWVEADGITSNDFEPYIYHVEKDGSVWFGTTNGFTVFNPKDFKDIDFSTKPNVPLNILSFEQFSDETKKLENRTQQILQNQEIVLNPGEQLFNLRVALADYVTGEDAQYAYRIKGVQDFWQEGKENLIRISGLPYGTFNLEIRGKLASGQYSSKEIHLPIQVLKPFYLKTWFFIAAGTVLFLGFFSWYKWRTRQLKRQQLILEGMVKKRTETIEEQAAELRKMDQLKSRFFANVSHELRTPLTLMLGPTGSLLKRGYLSDKDLKLLQYIYNNEKHLLGLVNEILDLSKLETGRIKVKETAVNFFDFLNPLVAQFKSFGDSVSVKFLFDFQLEEDLWVLVDTNKLEKIINNFLSNALKFTPDGGTVTLTVGEKEDNFLLKVEDTGSGIHPEDLPHIFERFFQSKLEDAPVQGGTGIGLSLCKELSELLNGKVWAESEFGKGSTFYFEFPKKEVAAGAIKTTAAIENGKTFGGRTIKPPILEKAIETQAPVVANGKGNKREFTILATEDNFELRNYLQTILEDDYHVLQAENGQVALELLSKNKVDLLISDLMMPIMDGFQLLEKVKSSGQWSGMPVIMLTARADIKVKLRALRIGVDDYITKPFEEEELLVRIENLLNNYKERQALIPSTNGNNERPSISSEDMEYLENLEEMVKEMINDYRLNSDFLASKMVTSRSALFKNVKRLTGMTPNAYINEVRYTTARELMEQKRVTSVKATAGKVGMKDVKYFSKQFKSRFGKAPSSYF